MAGHDLIVIGGGAAGLSAAAAAAGRGLSVLLIDRMGGGGELMNLGTLVDVDGDRTGPDLAAELLDQAVAAGVELAVAAVTGLAPAAHGWQVATDDGETHAAGVVMLAVGLAPGTLGVDNEDAFAGQGLSHCAACDGPLHAGQPVVVAGADRWARHEAHELLATAGSVTLVTQDEPATDLAGVTVLAGRIAGLDGAGGLEAVAVRPADGGPPLRLPARAVFVQTGRRPALDFAPPELARDDDGRVLADETGRTNLPCLFVAGDARAAAPRTLAGARCDGKRAAAGVPVASPVVSPVASPGSSPGRSPGRSPLGKAANSG